MREPSAPASGEVRAAELVAEAELAAAEQAASAEQTQVNPPQADCTVLNRSFYNFFLGFSGRCTFFRPRFCEISENPQNSDILSNSLALREIPKKIYEIYTKKCRIK